MTVPSRQESGPTTRRKRSPESLQVEHREPLSVLSRGQQWRAWVRVAHTGEAGGWWGETLASFTAPGAPVLSLTGVFLAFNRLQRWRRRIPHA